MAKKMSVFALLATSMTIFCVALYRSTGNGLFLTLAITFGTISYHFIMRLFVGISVNLLLNNHVNYRRKWFQVSGAEQKLYKMMKVKKWKGKMPTFELECFDSTIHT